MSLHSPYAPASFVPLKPFSAPLTILCSSFLPKPISISISTTRNSLSVTTIRPLKFRNKAFLNQFENPSPTHSANEKSSAHYSSLRVLEWDKLCDSVASFAATSLGRQATKAQLWSLNQTYEESLRLLEETNAAIEMHKHGGCKLDFGSIDTFLVGSAIQHVRMGLPVEGNEAMAVAAMLELAELLQFNLRTAIKEDSEWYRRFAPLSEMIMRMVISRSLVRLIQQVIDEDGSVKDSASPTLKRLRDQLRSIEKKLYQLIDNLLRSDKNETSFLEVSNINGRWCVKSTVDQSMSFDGLLVSSGSAAESIVEPLSAVPLNDELQQTRALVAEAERDVLLELTDKMQINLGDIENILLTFVEMDVINARATYSLSFGGSCPDMFLPENSGDPSTLKTNLSESKASRREWILYLPKAYHPLLVQQHRKNLQKARKDLSDAVAQMRKKLQGEHMTLKGEPDIDLSVLELQVTSLEQAPPVPVDFSIASKTRVLVITGPNTGGKTICLKTIGLVAMMAKSGLYVLSSESAKIPWFDSVFADIGDEQSLSRSLSTFSGHLRQISDIQSQSTSQSLVLLDEVGAGTNPVEGAALGMSLLESFAESGALLTIATTHHGEIKALKYSNDAFENACMEFDEVDLKPTYKILWGIPGRSNAIRIAERLGLPKTVVDKARSLHGVASAEINEVIIDMERFKQDFQELISNAEYHLGLSRKMYEKLLVAKRRIMEHVKNLRRRKLHEISEAAAIVRSILHRKARQQRAVTVRPSQSSKMDKTLQKTSSTIESTKAESSNLPTAQKTTSSVEVSGQLPSEKKTWIPKVGDSVFISSLRKEATVLKIDLAKKEVVVQAGNMKFKLKLTEIGA